MSAEPQLLVPMRSPRRATMVEVGVHAHAGRLEQCLRCGRLVWTSFGRARRHRRYCRSQRWPFGRRTS